jgi:hypothetical protein
MLRIFELLGHFADPKDQASVCRALLPRKSFEQQSACWLRVQRLSGRNSLLISVLPVVRNEHRRTQVYPRW